MPIFCFEFSFTCYISTFLLFEDFFVVVDFEECR